MSRRLDLVGEIESSIEDVVRGAENPAGGLYERIVCKAFYECISEHRLRSAIADTLRPYHLICNACYQWEKDNTRTNPSVTDDCRCPTEEQLHWFASEAIK